MLAADVADVAVAPGVLDDDTDEVDAALVDDELPPQPVSSTKAMSTGVTAANGRRASAATFVASMVIIGEAP